MKKVCVIGLWHLGLVSAACLAELGHDVVAADPDEKLIADLKRGKLPLFEPGLEDLIQKMAGSARLHFENNLQTAVSGVKTVLITYDTPVDEKDQADLALFEKTMQTILPSLDRDAVLIINSQVPVGSSENWQRVIDEARPDGSIDLVYSPENLRLGQALSLFKQPDMIVVGADTERAKSKAEEFYGVFPVEKIFVSRRTAEMAKHALNTFFATSISFANEIGNLCDAVGADGFQVAQILKKDSRIGAKAQVRPGLGFAGATLARDIRALQSLGKKTGTTTALMDTVFEINEKQTGRVVKIVEEYFEENLGDKTFTILGLTYKPGTSTLRRSVSIEIMKRLHAKGARIQAHDPKADLSEYRGEKFFQLNRDVYAACQGSHGILVLTEWPEYQELDYGRIKKVMAGSFFLDAKNHLSEKKLELLGFNYLQIGRGQLKERVKR